MRFHLVKILLISSFVCLSSLPIFTQTVEERVEKLEEQRVSHANSIYRRKNEIKEIRNSIDSLKKQGVNVSQLIDSLFKEVETLSNANDEMRAELAAQHEQSNEQKIESKKGVPIFYKIITFLFFLGLILSAAYFFFFRKERNQEENPTSNFNRNNLKRFWFQTKYRFNEFRVAAKENLFFDFRIIGFFAFLFLSFVILFYPDESYFQTPSLETMIYVTDRSLRASAVFIGIIISLVILSFQIFNKNYGRYAFIGFFNNRYIKVLFTLYVINILFSLYALGYFHEIEALNSFAIIIYYTGLASNLILILCLFPFSVQMLKKSQSRYNLEKIITLIDEKWIANYNFHQQNNIKNLEITENNPIRMLQEIGIVAAKRDDIVTLELIFDGLYSHMEKLVMKHDKKHSSLNRYFYFQHGDLINNLFLHVLKTNNFQMVNFLLKKRYDLEVFLLDNKLQISPWDTEKWSYKGWDMSFDFEEYFSKSVLEKNDEFAERVIGVYYSYCEYLIKNYFPDTFKEYDFQKFKDYSNEKHMCTSHLSSNIGKFTDLSIKHNQIGLFTKIFNFFSLESVTLDSENSDSVKTFLLHVMKFSKSKAFEKYLNSGITSIASLNFPYLSWVVDSEVEKLKRKTVFIEMKKAINLAFSKELLDNKILNNLKALGMGFVNKIDKGDHFKKLLVEVIDQFDYLRSLIKEDSNNYQKDIYIKLHKYLGYIQNHFLEKTDIDSNEGIKKSFKRTLEEFDKLEEYKSNLEDIGYISNENLF